MKDARNNIDENTRSIKKLACKFEEGGPVATNTSNIATNTQDISTLQNNSGSLIVPNTAFVQSNGDDGTGVIGDRNKPYATPTAAANALNTASTPNPVVTIVDNVVDSEIPVYNLMVFNIEGKLTLDTNKPIFNAIDNATITVKGTGTLDLATSGYFVNWSTKANFFFNLLVDNIIGGSPNTGLITMGVGAGGEFNFICVKHHGIGLFSANLIESNVKLNYKVKERKTSFGDVIYGFSGMFYKVEHYIKGAYIIFKSNTDINDIEINLGNETNINNVISISNTENRAATYKFKISGGFSNTNATQVYNSSVSSPSHGILLKDTNNANITIELNRPVFQQGIIAFENAKATISGITKGLHGIYCKTNSEIRLNSLDFEVVQDSVTEELTDTLFYVDKDSKTNITPAASITNAVPNTFLLVDSNYITNL